LVLDLKIVVCHFYEWMGCRPSFIHDGLVYHDVTKPKPKPYHTSWLTTLPEALVGSESLRKGGGLA
jgi:hypothetical protein